VAENGFRMDFAKVPQNFWDSINLVFVCSPGNPADNVMSLAEWETLFALPDTHGFVIAADECYSEISFPLPSPLPQAGEGVRRRSAGSPPRNSSAVASTISSSSTRCRSAANETWVYMSFAAPRASDHTGQSLWCKRTMD